MFFFVFFVFVDVFFFCVLAFGVFDFCMFFAFVHVFFFFGGKIYGLMTTWRVRRRPTIAFSNFFNLSANVLHF